MQKKIKALLGGALLALVAAQAQAANYATCILDKAPGAVNDIAAQAVHQVCLKTNPGAIQAVPQGSGRGLMGYNSGAECVVAKARDTRSNQAAAMIGVACRKLYDEPVKLIPFSGKLDGEIKLTPFSGKLDGEK